MLTYKIWKQEKYDIKHNHAIDDFDMFVEFVILVITTPIIIVLDILLLPIEILYYIFKKIK